MAFDPSKFSVKTPKSIPVLLLLDVSGSMYGDKIDSLNEALKDMLDGFKQAQTLETFIKLSIITFGSSINLHTELKPVSDIEQISPLRADGWTPLGAALSMAKEMIEDKDIFISGDYRPTIVLLSDGEPNDDWINPLNDFVNSGRSSKCDRLAIAFGKDADTNMLNTFIDGCENPLLYAEDAKDIHKVFKKVTMSVTMRTKFVNKDQVVKFDDISLDDDPTKY